MAPWSTYRKAASIGAVALAATLTVTACGSDSADSGTATASAAPGGVALVNAGKLTTCTHLPYEPFQSKQGGKVVGFDVDIIDLVAKKLGVSRTIVDTAVRGHQVRPGPQHRQVRRGRRRHDDHRRSGRRSSTSPTRTSTPPRRCW